MTVTKTTAVFAMIIVIALSSLLFALSTVYGANAPGLTGFMDLEASVKALQLKVDKAQSSLVMIVAYDDTGAESGRGSGFFIDGEGRIITNAVLMKDAYSAVVFSVSNRYEEVLILSQRGDLDLALIQVKVENETPLELGFESVVKQGERVIVVGKSSQSRTTVSEGLINTVNMIGETSDYYIEIEPTAGLLANRPSKDGPVINMEGKVIGITTKTVSNPENHDDIPKVYFDDNLRAISVSAIKRLAASQDSIEFLHLPQTRVWHRWFINKLETTFLFTFIYLFNLGFNRIMKVIIAFALMIYLIQRFYRKIKKIKFGK